MPHALRRPLTTLAAALLAVSVAACGGGDGGPAGPAVVEVAVVGPDGYPLVPATDVAPAGDGSVVVTLDELDVSAVARVEDGEVVSRALFEGSALDVVPRPDGSVAVVASPYRARGVLVAVVPPGGEPDETLDVRPTTPPTYLGNGADDGYAVLAPDGRTVVLLHSNGAAPVLTAIDPDSGEVTGTHPLAEWVGAAPLGLFLTDDGAGMAVVLGVEAPGQEPAAVVLRLPGVLPGDLPATPPPAQRVPGTVVPGAAAVGPADEVVLVAETRAAGSSTVSLVGVPADGSAPTALATLPSSYEEFPNGYWEDVLVGPDGTRAWVAGEAGEDSDVAEPVLVQVDLTAGTVGPLEHLSDAGVTGPMALVGDTLVMAGYTTVRRTRASTSVVWYLPT
ncbi:hypothetical protein [Blastococcus sp. SYSU D00813]